MPPTAGAFQKKKPVARTTMRAKDNLKSTDDNEQLSRREAIINAGQAAGAIMIAGVLGSSPQSAEAKSIKEANNELTNYGVSPFEGNVPQGFSPLVEVWGKDGIRPPYLISFLYPALWVIQKPSMTTNGESGTYAAGNYQKGDSAAVYVGPSEVDGNDVMAKGKDYISSIVLGGLTQKGENQYQNFKTTKIVAGATGLKGQKYYVVDFKYELLTGAGFYIDRRGVAAVTGTPKNVQAIVCATTDTRYKKLADDLHVIADSFRAYDGKILGLSYNLGDEL
eukprot:CAMPEP_0113943100 /NCGR_PEP_ID=MMETSP1339-20121228/19177_1 /TAXON_ID=94617 /ORGANISM="Fibrocapsa japonica" /LENGTH=278 /DNA_ID=CAMNT_0000947869 /DNA_START=170 /DNA_END=1006 /DNA_ORIENTATION=- /assembly_acc=CAM_ASM_000762